MTKQRSYLELRTVAQQISDTQRELNHPCVEGNGACCTADAQTTQMDIHYMLEGFKSGELPIEILHEAVARVTEENPRCPFLDEDNRCSVYNRRPLLCMSNEGIYIGKDAKNSKRLMKMADKGRFETVVPYDWLGNQMCAKCHKACQQLPDRHPLKNIQLARIIGSIQFVNLIRVVALQGGFTKVEKMSDVPLIIARLLGENLESAE